MGGKHQDLWVQNFTEIRADRRGTKTEKVAQDRIWRREKCPQNEDIWNRRKLEGHYENK